MCVLIVFPSLFQSLTCWSYMCVAVAWAQVYSTLMDFMWNFMMFSEKTEIILIIVSKKFYNSAHNICKRIRRAPVTVAGVNAIFRHNFLVYLFRCFKCVMVSVTYILVRNTISLVWSIALIKFYLNTVYGNQWPIITNKPVMFGVTMYMMKPSPSKQIDYNDLTQFSAFFVIDSINVLCTFHAANEQ